jgi:hypothetical protein
MDAADRWGVAPTARPRNDPMFLPVLPSIRNRSPKDERKLARRPCAAPTCHVAGMGRGGRMGPRSTQLFRRQAVILLLWEFGNQFEKFGLRPSPDGSGAHVSQRADREREFSNVVPIWGIDNENEVVVAGS